VSDASSFAWRRVNAMLVRHWYGTIRSFDRLTDSFYWITIDLILWGITAGYVQSQISSGDTQVFFVIISGVIMWSIVYRSQMDVGMGLLDELWNKNLINLFASPLRFNEWILSLLLFSFLKALVAVSFGSIVAWILYSMSITNGLGWYLVPLFLILVLNGWWIGLLIQSIIMRLTTKAQALAWTFVWILSPLSVIYFPLSAIPPFAQQLARGIPTSYVFEEMRNVLAGRPLSWVNLGIALSLSLVYLLIAFLMVQSSFRWILNKGLGKVY